MYKRNNWVKDVVVVVAVVILVWTSDNKKYVIYQDIENARGTSMGES